MNQFQDQDPNIIQRYDNLTAKEAWKEKGTDTIVKWKQRKESQEIIK